MGPVLQLRVPVRVTARVPPQGAAHFDYTSPLLSHGEGRLQVQEVLGPREYGPEAGQGSSQGSAPAAPGPRVQQEQTLCAQPEPHNLTEQPGLERQRPTPLGDVILQAEWASRTLPVKVTRGK